MKRRKAFPTLQAFLEETGTPQYVVAKRAKITQGHLSLILRGERTPSLPLALELAKIANIPVETLVGKLHTDAVS